jgi:hypothetical protein
MALKSHSTRDEALTENEARINTNENILPLDTYCFLVETTTKSQIDWQIQKYKRISIINHTSTHEIYMVPQLKPTLWARRRKKFIMRK